MILTGEHRSARRKTCLSAICTPYSADYYENRNAGGGGIFGPKEQKVTGRWKLHKEEIGNVYQLQKLEDSHSCEEELEEASGYVAESKCLWRILVGKT